MNDTLILAEITDDLDTLADMMVSDRTDELAGYGASFRRDAAAYLRQLTYRLPEETTQPYVGVAEAV